MKECANCKRWVERMTGRWCPCDDANQWTEAGPDRRCPKCGRYVKLRTLEYYEYGDEWYEADPGGEG
jgi:hypothetical protein